MSDASHLDKAARRAKVIDVLNKARSMELFAISQYMMQHYGLDAMDYGELAKNMKLIAIDEMRHAEQFAERIKELDGDPVTSPDATVQKNQDAPAIYAFDTDLEDNTIDVYNQFLRTCQDMGDNISATLFETIIEEEQEHLNYFDNIGSHIQNLGAAYLSKVAGTPASTGGPSKGFALGGGA